MNQLNVLILDDEKRLTEELTEFLVESGFQAYEANTGREGLLILKKQPIDLLILDIRLSGENGLDILKEVKVKYPNIEVIMISAHGDMDTVIEAMRLGAIDYLRKPFLSVRAPVKEPFLWPKNSLSNNESVTALLFTAQNKLSFRLLAK